MQTIIVDVLSIILSLVALAVTIIGFFASLRFYREGMALQGLAADALTKLEEKTHFIQTQVGGIFERTLDAAIGRREIVSESFAVLDEQVEKTGSKITEEALKQIGAAGEHERRRLKEVVDNEIEILRGKIGTTQESVEKAASDAVQIPGPETLARILALLSSEGGELSASEIAERLREDYLPVITSLRKLSQIGVVIEEGEGRRKLYKFNNKDPGQAKQATTP